MIRGLNRFLSLPKLFDEEETIESRKVWWVLIGMLAAVTIFFPVGAVLQPAYASRFLGITACFDTLFLALLIVTRIGFHRLASVVLVMASVVMVGAFAWTSGGVRSPGMMALPLFVGIAGILRGARGATLTGFACVAVSLALLEGEHMGRLPPPSVHYTALAICVVFVFLTALFVVVHLVGTSHVRRLEEARRDSERRYYQLFRQAQIGIYRTTPEGRILEANPALLSMLGYQSVQQLHEFDLEERGTYLPKYPRELFRSMVEKGEVRGLESEWRRMDGTLVVLRENARVIRDAAGNALYYDGTVEDFTERKHLEAQLQQSSKMEAIGQLAGGVAHDFNNILTGLLLNVGIAQREAEQNPVIRKSLAEMEFQTKRAAALTRRLLLFGRQQTFEPRTIDLNAHVEELLATLLRRIVGPDYTITFDRAPGTLQLNADPSMVDQIVMNLCINARDSMASGGEIVVRAREINLEAADASKSPKAWPGHFVRLDVIDTGSGMTESTMKRLFEPFFTTKEIGKGTGLGLAAVQNAVHQHNGWVDVESTLGKGSQFSVFLPA
jgi:PAS domain S-box-containing protein